MEWNWVKQKALVPARYERFFTGVVNYIVFDIVPLTSLAELEKNYKYGKDFTMSYNYLDTLEGKNLPVEHCIKGTKGHDIPDSILRGHDVIFEKLMKK